jgi:Na+-transporting methylmalonyl-CoA/oxaloacetate decarboxylase beta subunit
MQWLEAFFERMMLCLRAAAGIQPPRTVGIIGGADGPTAIYLTQKPAQTPPGLVPAAICVAAVLIAWICFRGRK